MKDQKDVATQLAESSALLTTLMSVNQTAQQQLESVRLDITRLTAERDDALQLIGTDVKTLCAERDSARADVTRLTTELNTANTNVARLTESQRGFDDRLRSDLLRLGVRSSAITLPEGNKQGEKLTIDEMVMATKAAEKYP